jgi:hypothetical protein
MKVQLVVLFWMAEVAACAQDGSINLEKISFNGLGLISTREEIIKSFGKPDFVDANYECGAFTNDQPGAPYYFLDYKTFNYIGSDKEKFTLHKIAFDAKGFLELRYADKKLSGLTTRAEFIEMFGDVARNHFRESPDADSILLYSQDTDDGVIFTFRGDKLIGFQYWTPC